MALDDTDEERRSTDTATGGGDGDEPQERMDRRPSRTMPTLVAAPIVALIVAANVGDAIAPALVDTHPNWLIALSARNRNMVLVTNEIDAWSFYGIGVVRQFMAEPLFFLLGYWYGDAAVRWMERRTKTWGTMMRRFEQGFGKLAYPLVFAVTNNVISLLAGASRMSMRAFIAVGLAGTVTRLVLIRIFGEVFESPLDSVVDWIGDNRIPLLVVTVGLVILSLATEWKRGEADPTLSQLDEESRAEDEAEAAGDRSEPR